MVSIICKKVQFQFLVRLMLLGIEDPQEPAVFVFVEKGNKTVLMVSIICKKFTFGTFLFSAYIFCCRIKTNINCESVVRETNGLKIYCVLCQNVLC